MPNQMLSDRDAICELKGRYCRLLDFKQWDAWTDLLVDAFVLDTSEAGGPPPITGRSLAVAAVRQHIETARTAHQVHTPEIAIAGDGASGVWAMQDHLVYDDGTRVTGYGHYIETYLKRDGEWKIASSKLTRLIVDVTMPTVAEP